MALKSRHCLMGEEVASPSPTHCTKVSLYLHSTNWVKIERKTVAS